MNKLTIKTDTKNLTSMTSFYLISQNVSYTNKKPYHDSVNGVGDIIVIEAYNFNQANIILQDIICDDKNYFSEDPYNMLLFNDITDTSKLEVTLIEYLEKLHIESSKTIYVHFLNGLLIEVLLEKELI